MVQAQLCNLRLVLRTCCEINQLGIEGPKEVPEIIVVLDEFADVFQDPKGLLSSRGHHDHGIMLWDRASPVNIRPYKHPMLQKDVIEKLVA